MNQSYRKSLKSRAVLSGLALALAGSMAAIPTAAQAAGTAAATVNASATVNSQCNVQTSTLTMAFGTVDVLAASGGVNAPATLTVQCNKGAQVSVTANNGSNFSGGKRMKNSANTDMLAYSILQPTGASFSTCPASISAGTELTSTALDVKSLWASGGGPKNITLCGRLEGPQADASPGSYSDTVTVTVTY
ncbi:MAG TPA: spore coat protein U domain-containing protein [Quisquiliibacterium sp.]|nr:spore coat protein U domain-containing protein [Quisquiliibacterium sp.]